MFVIIAMDFLKKTGRKVLLVLTLKNQFCKYKKVTLTPKTELKCRLALELGSL